MSGLKTHTIIGAVDETHRHPNSLKPDPFQARQVNAEGEVGIPGLDPSPSVEENQILVPAPRWSVAPVVSTWKIE